MSKLKEEWVEGKKVELANHDKNVLMGIINKEDRIINKYNSECFQAQGNGTPLPEESTKVKKAKVIASIANNILTNNFS